MKRLKRFDELHEKFYTNDDQSYLDEEVPESMIINVFKEYGLSADENDNPINSITYDNDEIIVSFTSYAFGGELPNNVSDVMDKISKKIGASDWTFWEPMDQVRFFYD